MRTQDDNYCSSEGSGYEDRPWSGSNSNINLRYKQLLSFLHPNTLQEMLDEEETSEARQKAVAELLKRFDTAIAYLKKE